MKRQKRSKWAYLYMPIFFLVLGYGMFYVIFSPVLQFVSSAVQIVSLDQAPKFDSIEKVNTSENKNENEKDEENGKENLPEPENEKTLSEHPSSELIAASEIVYPKIGEQYGEIRVSNLGIKEILSFGDSDEELRVGAGQYTGSTFPGENGTTLIGGHNNSTFGFFSLIQENDSIELTTKYGSYQYRVYKSEVARFDTEEIPKLLEQQEKDIIVFYTCYPVDMLGLTDDRLFIYAELESGSVIDENS